ncbi:MULTISPECIES: transposase [unclassified Mesorhizobium]|uniref:transposase n=1 Tax=unclassified Mesorhizobium TaxID=325217 RepID=UPI00336BC685
MRVLIREVQAELAELDQRIASYDRRVRELFRNSELCQRLGKIEGIGPVTATALIAAVGDRTCFKNGRQFAAWLGLVPKQRSSGGRARLFGISKRGDRYLRTLMIHGARAALGKAAGKQDPRSLWLRAFSDLGWLRSRCSCTFFLAVPQVTRFSSRSAPWPPHDGVRRARCLNLFHDLAGFSGRFGSLNEIASPIVPTERSGHRPFGRKLLS